MRHTSNETDLIRIVLADANVLYSRVLRDYLLYAADQEIIAISWSPQILAEATEHLMKNVEGFDRAAAQRLTSAMNRAFPYAEVEPDEEHWRQLRDLTLPDEDDRHVLASSLAAARILRGRRCAALGDGVSGPFRAALKTYRKFGQTPAADQLPTSTGKRLVREKAAVQIRSPAALRMSSPRRAALTGRPGPRAGHTVTQAVARRRQPRLILLTVPGS